jgi:hypothetical protein
MHSASSLRLLSDFVARKDRCLGESIEEEDGRTTRTRLLHARQYDRRVFLRVGARIRRERNACVIEARKNTAKM